MLIVFLHISDKDSILLCIFLKILQVNLMAAYQNMNYLDYTSRNKSEYIRNLREFSIDCLQGIESLLRLVSEGIVVISISVYTDWSFIVSTSSSAQEKNRKINIVFGCGGERDKGKRPLMGLVAEVGADFSVVTSDNPRKESAMNIIEEILSGLETNDFIVEANRKDAIELALRRANKNDVIVIAGKGHETTQEISGRLFDFNDREVAEGLISEIFRDED